MVKKITAIVFIFGCTAVAWFILGATIFARTNSADSHLRNRIASNWGAPHTQISPTGSYEKLVSRSITTVVEGQPQSRTVQEEQVINLPLESSLVDVKFDLQHRQKGLLWYSTYKVSFSGAYTFRNTSRRAEDVSFTFHFPAQKAIYDDLTILVDDTPLDVVHRETAASGIVRIPAGKAVVFKVSYLSQGLERWRYTFGSDVSLVRDFSLKILTNFKDIDFPEDALSPSEKSATADGWELAWNYKSLVSGYQIGLDMPRKLQPGPLAGRISFFAPVSLFFFFFILFIITTIRNIDLHPMNYFFLAAAFFSFHLLLAYLVDHISIHAAFVICSLISVFLVVSYLRLVVGIRFAAVEAGLAQLVYLVLFSYAFFLEGFTGLAITIGSIISLFVTMQMTGRIRWAEKFERKP